jgi:hypothetical protein
MLSARAALAEDAWAELFRPDTANVRIPRFALLRFSQYSGLQFNRTGPDDDLTQDLLFPDVTYSDWDFDLFEDFDGSSASISLGSGALQRSIPFAIGFASLRPWLR